MYEQTVNYLTEKMDTMQLSFLVSVVNIIIIIT